MNYKKIFKILRSSAILLFCTYIIFGLFLFFFQKKLIYYPSNQDFDLCPAFSDAQKINHNGTRFYHKENSDKLIIFYHGNAGSACDRGFLKNLFEQNDFSYIFVEYAGYSNDKAKPSIELILQDAVNVNDFISTISYSELIVASESIGSGPASFHTTLRKVDKLALIAPFAKMSDIAQDLYPIYPAKLLLTEKYDNQLWLEEYYGKLIIIHGAKDNIIPIKHSKKLFENISTSKKQHITINNAGHNNIYSFDKTANKLSNFLLK